MEIYFNGKYVNGSEPQVLVDDRSYRFGDGLFETAIIYNGKVRDWERHQRRFENGLKFYGYDIDVSNIPQIANELIKKNNIREGYIRAVVSRGAAPGVGYKIGDARPYLVVQVFESPLPEFREITLVLAEIRAYYHTPCKTNNALLYTRAMMEADAAGCDNALLLSHDGYICETSNANLFWIRGDVLYTPALDLPLVPGTFRENVLEFWKGGKQEGKFPIEDLHKADEIFMANVGGIITSIKEIKPLGIKPKSREKTALLREKIIKQITA